VATATIAYARSAEDEARIETALDRAGIAYSIRLDAVAEASAGTACSLAQVYAVDESEASRAKATLESAGLARALM
jgi:hypothetical protein